MQLASMPRRPCASCTVATPALPRASMIAASARSMFCTTTFITPFLSKLVDGAGEDRLEALGVFRRAAAGLSARIALEVVCPVLRDPRVELPKVLLAFHALDRRPLLVPHRGDVEEDVRLPAHLFGLVRLEQVELRRAEHLLARLVAPDRKSTRLNSS